MLVERNENSDFTIAKVPGEAAPGGREPCYCNLVAHPGHGISWGAGVRRGLLHVPVLL